MHGLSFLKRSCCREKGGYLCGCLDSHMLKETCKGVFSISVLIFLTLIPINGMCDESASGIQFHRHVAPPFWLISVSLMISLGPLVICLCTLDLHLIDVFPFPHPSQK